MSNPLNIERLWEDGLSVNNLDKVDSFLTNSNNEAGKQSTLICTSCGANLNHFSSCSICPSCGNKECGD